MKKFGIFLTIIGIILLTGIISSSIIACYQYEKQFQSYWDLADKSATIEEKSHYIDIFVENYKKADLAGYHNAIIFKTPNNSFDKNFRALQSLQSRLQEIKIMDVKSFEYQTAIQQITQQEQGEAYQVLYQLSGAWYIKHYFFIWNWMGVVSVVITITILLIGIFYWCVGYEHDKQKHRKSY